MSKTLISILAGLGGMFGWGVSDFFANLSSGKIGHTKAFFWSQVAGMLALGILMLFLPTDYSLSVNLLLLLVVTSIFYAVGYLLFYKAFEIGNVSVVSASINLNVVIAMLLAFIFKGQTLSGLQFVAISAVLVGVTLVSINQKDLTQKKVGLVKGVKETILASIAFGVFWNISEYLSEIMGWLPSAFFVKVFALFSLVLWSLLLKGDKLNYSKKHLNILYIVALVGLLEALAVASVSFGLEVGDLILVSPISSALSVVTISMAVIFLKEKLSKNQVAGIILTVLGIVLTAF